MKSDTQQKSLAGVVGFFDEPGPLVEAMNKVREANYEKFDAFTPYPVHGLEKAQGLKRSHLPWVTFGAGLTGFLCALTLQYWTSAVSWPLNVGGKAFFSWQAFVPVMFELTVLFGGLATVGAMLLINGLPNTRRKAIDPSLTTNRFAIWIEAPQVKSAEDEEASLKKPSGFKEFTEAEASAFLKSVGAQEVRTVYAESWF